MKFFIKQRSGLPYRILCGFIACAFLFSMGIPPGSVYGSTPLTTSAQLSVPATVLNLPAGLPAPGTMIQPTEAFLPALVKGITIHPENPLEFDFIVSPGDSGLEGRALSEEATKLIKYFLASLTVPAEELWVNLSPYEKDRIIPDGFGDTEMGRDLLAQDYLLKQLASSMMYPEDEFGKKFWKRIYAKAYEKFGTTEIPMNTFNKIWIIPETATVYEHENNTAFVVENHLKVLLEEDYLALANNPVRAPEQNNIATDIIREILIPAIEKEVNEGATFANLRQIYHSMVLAAWYKRNLKDGLLARLYMDQNKTLGVDTEDKQINQKIYDQYVESFKKGVYDYIREDYDPATKQIIPRKYFSGGSSAVALFDEKEDVFKLLKSGTPSANSPVFNRLNRMGDSKNIKVNFVEAANTKVEVVIKGIQKKYLDEIYEGQAEKKDAEFALAASSPLFKFRKEIENYEKFKTALKNYRTLAERPFKGFFRRRSEADYYTEAAQVEDKYERKRYDVERAVLEYLDNMSFTDSDLFFMTGVGSEILTLVDVNLDTGIGNPQHVVKIIEQAKGSEDAKGFVRSYHNFFRTLAEYIPLGSMKILNPGVLARKSILDAVLYSENPGHSAVMLSDLETLEKITSFLVLISEDDLYQVFLTILNDENPVDVINSYAHLGWELSVEPNSFKEDDFQKITKFVYDSLNPKFAAADVLERLEEVDRNNLVRGSPESLEIIFRDFDGPISASPLIDIKEMRGEKTILVVDDEKEWRESTVKVLYDAGYKTVAVRSGREALEILEKSRPDFLLTDLAMDRVNGVDVVVKAKEAYSDLPFMIITTKDPKDFGIYEDLIRKQVENNNGQVRSKEEMISDGSIVLEIDQVFGISSASPVTAAQLEKIDNKAGWVINNKTAGKLKKWLEELSPYSDAVTKFEYIFETQEHRKTKEYLIYTIVSLINKFVNQGYHGRLIKVKENGFDEARTIRRMRAFMARTHPGEALREAGRKFHEANGMFPGSPTIAGLEYTSPTIRGRLWGYQQAIQWYNALTTAGKFGDIPQKNVELIMENIKMIDELKMFYSPKRTQVPGEFTGEDEVIYVEDVETNLLNGMKEAMKMQEERDAGKERKSVALTPLMPEDLETPQTASPVIEDGRQKTIKEEIEKQLKRFKVIKEKVLENKTKKNPEGIKEMIGFLKELAENKYYQNSKSLKDSIVLLDGLLTSSSNEESILDLLLEDIEWSINNPPGLKAEDKDSVKSDDDSGKKREEKIDGWLNWFNEILEKLQKDKNGEGKYLIARNEMLRLFNTINDYKEINTLDEIEKIIKDLVPKNDSSKSHEKFEAESVWKMGSAIRNLKSSSALGGISLNPELLDLQIKRDGNGVPLPVWEQPIESMTIEGFVPIIINVTPVNIPLMLGLSDTPVPSDQPVTCPPNEDSTLPCDNRFRPSLTKL